MRTRRNALIMGPMSFRVRHRTLIWLLPLMLWRLLLPVGFMPGTTAGSPLVLCSMHHVANAAGGAHPADGTRDGTHADKVCPFSVAGVAAPTATAATPTAGLRSRVLPLALAEAQRLATPGPARHLPSRAPPPPLPA
jgi:hypothetical protein